MWKISWFGCKTRKEQNQDLENHSVETNENIINLVIVKTDFFIIKVYSFVHTFTLVFHSETNHNFE